MTESEHQTSIFMNHSDPPPEETGNGRRLLSSSGDDNNKAPLHIPRTRLTRPSNITIRAFFGILILLSIAIAITIIVMYVAVPPRRSSLDDGSNPSTLDEHHIRCNNHLVIGDQRNEWKPYFPTLDNWRDLPEVKSSKFAIVSRKYYFRHRSPGVQISLYLPHESTFVHVIASTSRTRHSKTVSMTTRPRSCHSIVIDDADFFRSNDSHFRIHLYFEREMALNGSMISVTSLPHVIRLRGMMNYKEVSSEKPSFVRIVPGMKDVCNVEIVDSSKVKCNWWNVEDGDNADFKKLDRHDCVSSGVSSSSSATWFFSVTSEDKNVESRALMLSPIIERKSSSLFLTLWYMIKCSGPSLRIHLVPAGISFHHLLQLTSDPSAEINMTASHSAWKFRSFVIPLPNTHKAYHIVLEGIVPPKNSCSSFACYTDGSAPKRAKEPMLVIDDITLELLNEQCPKADKPNIMDCSFEDSDGTSTTCGWKSSSPFDFPYYPHWDDWKPQNSGDGSDHGATEQHFEGRGYIMSFDATGKATAEAHIRTPLLRANSNCSCSMKFLYLLRGMLTPRLQVNLIYGLDTENNNRPLEPQWSLFGHQSEDWEVASLIINLKKNRPFQIEIRVKDVTDSQGDVHFDDLRFIDCDMDKYIT